MVVVSALTEKRQSGEGDSLSSSGGLPRRVGTVGGPDGQPDGKPETSGAGAQSYIIDDVYGQESAAWMNEGRLVVGLAGGPPKLCGLSLS